MGRLEIRDPEEYRTYKTDSRGRITLGEEYADKEVLIVVESAVVQGDDQTQSADNQ